MSEDFLESNTGFDGISKQLPNATTVLVLGILSIVGCLLYCLPGLVLGIIALVLHKKDKELYLSSPVAYQESYKTSNAGRICAVIGLSLSALFLVILVVYFVFVLSIFNAVVR